MSITLHLGDGLQFMREMEPQSIDAIITDLPYGTTACAWDEIIPFAPMWECVKRVLKQGRAFVTTASQPFTSKLIMSNLNNFNYCWYWNKSLPRGHLNANKQPLRVIEEIVVFYSNFYNPQKTTGHNRKVVRAKYKKDGLGLQVYGAENRNTLYDSTERFPNGYLQISTANQANKLHPTQKPVALYEYLIRTYTNPGDTVLDFCFGSGTTGVSAIRTGRNFVGSELDPDYFAIAEKRIHEATLQPALFQVDTKEQAEQAALL